MAPSLNVLLSLGLSKVVKQVKGQVKKKSWKKGVLEVTSSVWLVAASTCGVSTKLTVNFSSSSPPRSKLPADLMLLRERNCTPWLCCLSSARAKNCFIWVLFTGKEGDCGLERNIIFLQAGKTFPFTEEMEIH